MTPLVLSLRDPPPPCLEIALGASVKFSCRHMRSHCVPLKLPVMSLVSRIFLCPVSEINTLQVFIHSLIHSFSKHLLRAYIFP